jgi:glyoxylate reductase
VLVAQPLAEPSTSELLAAHEVRVLAEPSFAAAAPHLAGADALIATPRFRVDAALLAAAPRLLVVANAVVGVDHVDLEACRARGIRVTNTPGVLTDATADLAFALLLALARRLREGERLARSGSWEGWKPTELLGTALSGKVLGIFGAGRIGRAVARRGEAFGMTPILFDADGSAEDFERLLARSDVLSLHAPLTPETRGRFGRDVLFRMKRGALLVNTARGPLVDEAALVEALEAGHLGGAALDVFEHEPRIHPGLVQRDDVVLVPHIGSAAKETRLVMARLACEEVLRAFDGRPAIHPVG